MYSGNFLVPQPKMSSRHVLTRGKKQRALTLFRQQHLTEAAKLYEDICRIDPRDGEAWCALSAIYGALDQPTEAIRCAERAVEIEPRDAIAHNNVSAAYLTLGQREKAETSARRATEIAPTHVNALVNLGNALYSLDRIDEAVVAHESALRLDRQEADAYVGLALARTAQGRFDDAIALSQQALRLNPQLATGYNALGICLQTMGRYENAINAYRQAISLKPKFDTAWAGLGFTLMMQGALTEAVSCYERALSYAPDRLDIQINLATTLSMQGRLEDGIEKLRAVIAKDPAWDLAHRNLCFFLSYMPGADPAAVFHEHVRWGQKHTRAPDFTSYDVSIDLDRRLRVGYVSPDFYTHSAAYFVESILASHDPESVEIFCYANVSAPDATTERLQRLAHHWRNISGKTDEQAVELIREDGIDILVDLAGHTANSRVPLFAHKPAPVQVTYLGYPNTTGLSQIDYRLTDALADPAGQEAFHTETLVRLPHGFLCYRPPSDAPPVEPSPVIHAGQVTFGSFNAQHKINAAVVELWSKVLLQTPGSRLLIKNKAMRDAPTRERLLSLFQERGIGPDRIELLGWLDASSHHLAIYNRIDIALDTFPYNGTTTTCEALWMGVPVVTLAGIRHIERVGVSLLTHAGLPELIANSEEEYVRLAVELAGNVARLAKLRGEMRERVTHSSLCDAKGFTCSLEAAYREMWRRWVAQAQAAQ